MSLLLREPVRAAFGTLLASVVGLLVALEVIDDRTSAAVLVVVSTLGALLVELTRAQVTPAVNLPVVPVQTIAVGGKVFSGGSGSAVFGPNDTIVVQGGGGGGADTRKGRGQAGAGEVKLILCVVAGCLIAYLLVRAL